MTKDEALKLALEALVTAEAGLADIGDADREPTDDLAWCEERAAQALAKPRQAITALREALAQPEQDQFKPDWNTEAVLVEEMQRMAKRIEELEALAQEQWTPKDMAYRPGGLSQPEEQQSCGKREWVGLTDSEVDNIVAYPWGETKNWIKAVEDALKEKNA